MHKEKSKIFFDDSKPGSIGARIRVLLEKTNKSVSKLEEDGGIGNGTLKTWKDVKAEDIEDSTAAVQIFLNRSNINPVWWKTGDGPIFNTSVQKGSDNKEKTSMGDPEVYRTIVEGNTEYVLIPRTVLKDTKLISTEQIASDRRIMDRLLEQNEKMISKLLASEPELSGVKKGKHSP